jgi:hypothetical protein
MDPALSPAFSEKLPNEIVATIFEEHAKLEWRAPAIHGRVCRVWREIVLNAPRAWTYLETYDRNFPTLCELRLWLGRSGAAPLHLPVAHNFKLDQDKTFYDLLAGYSTRIASLRMKQGRLSFFEGRDFPHLRALEVGSWYPKPSPLSPVRWGLMPELQSLRLGSTVDSVEPLNGLNAMKMLVLFDTNCASLLHHSSSLTTLMLDDILIQDPISGPVNFPSLTYLSLYDVTGLKPHVNAPCLRTYHEGGRTVRESFPASLPSLVEYGVRSPLLGPDLDHTGWHYCFPNISRLSIRSEPRVFMSFLESLSGHPHLLPALQVISVGGRGWTGRLSKEDQTIMEGLVRVRNAACNTDITLCSRTGSASQIPIFFAEVCHCPAR